MGREPPTYNDFEPLITRPSSILCANAAYTSKSADELLSLKLRVEDSAKRYTEGKSLFIQSASLRGPFTGTWKNPWAPKRTAVLELRDYADRQVLQLRHQRAKQRRTDQETRLRRARTLQTDNLGKSAQLPVDLTNVLDDTNGATISNPDHEFRLAETCTNHPVNGQDSTYGTAAVPIALSGDAASNDVHTIFEHQGTEQGEQILQVSSRANAIQYNLPPSPRHKSKLLKTATPLHNPSSDFEKEYCSLPTPSESGDEGTFGHVASHSSANDEVKSGVDDRPVGSVGLASIANSRASLKRNLTTAFGSVQVSHNITITPSTLHNHDEATGQAGEKHSQPQLPLASAKYGADLCVFCKLYPIQIKCRGQCRLCNNAWQKERRRQLAAERQAQGAAKPQKSLAKQSKSTPLSANGGPESPATEERSSGSRYSFRERMIMSQPEPVAREASVVLRDVHKPASSFPPDNKPRAKSHRRTYRAVFPGGPLHAAQASKEDDGLVQLLGPLFRQRWKDWGNDMAHPARRVPRNPNEIDSDAPMNAATEGRPRKLMTFDTPVLRREASRNNANACKEQVAIVRPWRNDAALEVPKSFSEQHLDSENVQANKLPQSTEKPQVAGSLVDGEPPLRVEEHVRRYSISDAVIVSVSPACESMVTEKVTPNILDHERPSSVQSLASILDTGIHNLGMETPRTYRHKLLDMHTNKVLSAQESSLLRSLAKVHVESQIRTPLQGSHSAPNPRLPFVSAYDSPLISTQAAMLAAQAAFQEALASPVRDEYHVTDENASSSEAQKENVPLCNITPFHDLTRDVVMQDEMQTQRAEPQISTQALFDAFLSSQPRQDLLDSHMSPTTLEPQDTASSNLGNDPDDTFTDDIDMGSRTHAGRMDSFVQQADEFLGDWNVFGHRP